LDGW